MSLSCTIDSSGISCPDYTSILNQLVTAFQAIYGTDAYLGSDSQDFQLLAIFAAAINDCNNATVAAYNSFSPTYAQGAGLSSNVKINGIHRQVPSRSTVDLTIVGQNGTIITNGIAQDIVGNQWSLPASVTIPGSGSIVVTGTCTEEGAVTATIGTVTKVATPTLGWQTVTNAAAAVPGAPVETDAALRARQTNSVSLPALSVLDSIIAAIGEISGVQRFRVYENPTGGVDSDGIPAHSISVVTQGGDSQTIGNTIFEKKGAGPFTYGDIAVSVTDSEGIISTINRFDLIEVPITVEIDITTQTGYASTTAALIKQAVADSVNALAIGRDVEFSRLYTPALLANGPLSDTYNLNFVKISRSGSPSQADVVISFKEAATCVVGDISVVVS